MRVTVVINTYNRAPGLRTTLHALRYQTFGDFEVVVVNGPSTDDTETMLAAEAPDARLVRCPEARLSRSRNLGIAAAAGDVVAFIDDDAIPEPQWLAQLVEGYDTEVVGGVGGFVFDRTGVDFQWRYAVCSRLGTVRGDVEPPLDAWLARGADPVLYLQGTNCSFRRDLLCEVGGFDEALEHYYDDVGIAMRVVDAGYGLRIVPTAVVHHKCRLNRVRNERLVVVSPRAVVSDHAYFAMRHGRARRTRDEVLRSVEEYADGLRQEASRQARTGGLTAQQLRHFEAELAAGVHEGIARGERASGTRPELPPADPAAFRRFERLGDGGPRLNVCFLSRECPPDDCGGVGRYSFDLASGFASAGHAVHLITSTADGSRVDYEDGVWVHRVAAWNRWVPELDGVPLRPNLLHVAAAYHEVCRVHERLPVDLVSAPLWLCEGVVCSLDDRFPTVLTLMTAMKTIAGMHPSWADSPATRQLIALEDATVARARHVHAISEGILRQVRAAYRVNATDVFVAPLGVRDRAYAYPRRVADATLRILFVSRLERRKGVDVLLTAAAELLAEFRGLTFVLVGRDTPHTELATTYRAAFEREHARNRALRERVVFAGEVPEERLYQHYADADVFCLPSRYESFGLVLLEAMMFGLPVVATAVGGVPEVVEHEGNGLLVEPENPRALAAALGQLIRDADLRARLGRRSRERFEARFTLPIMTRNVLASYAQVVAAHRAHGGAAQPAPEARAARSA